MSRKSKKVESIFLKTLGKLFDIFRVFTNAVLAAGGTDEDFARIGKDPALLAELVAVIMKYAGGKAAEVKQLPIWKTLTLGALQTVDKYHAAIEASGSVISDWASQIMEKTPLAPALTTVELVLLTTAELTGKTKEMSTTDEVFAGQARLSLGKCPAEVGPALRLEYVDQPSGEWIRIGMEPIAGSGGLLFIFCVGPDEDGRRLRAHYAAPALLWPPGSRWVFVRGKP